MFKKIKDFMIKIIKKIKFECECQRADDLWYFLGGNCFGLFPPSFYMKHTPEEVERITKEEIAKLHAILEDFEKRNNLDSD